MELIPNKTSIDFVRLRTTSLWLSGILALVSVISLAWQGLNLGIDFSGGTMVQMRFAHPLAVDKIRAALTTLNLGDVVIQEFDSSQEVLIRVVQQSSGNDTQSVLVERLVGSLQPLVGDSKVDVRRVEFVGPQVGKELVIDGFLAVFYSLFAILAYVAWRFELRFALGAILALIHDALVIVGMFSLLQREFTLVVVAAILTVIGYSINDTIVVFDRIREEATRMKKQPMGMIINRAINETLSRTIIVSLTVVLVLIALLLFGGSMLHDFALALLCGVVLGTYSSIFVASPIVLLMERNPNTVKTDATEPEKNQ